MDDSASPMANTPEALSVEKAPLRKAMRKARAGMSVDARTVASAAIRERLTALPVFQRAGGVHCFLSLPEEVDTAPIIAASAEAGKRTFVPYVDSAAGRLGHTPWCPGQPLETGAFSLQEPPPGARTPVAWQWIELVLVPGLAFDRDGGRLGFGKGYYDAFLAMLAAGPRPPATVGLAFSQQIVPAVPMTVRDVRGQLIVTERETIIPEPAP